MMCKYGQRCIGIAQVHCTYKKEWDHTSFKNDQGSSQLRTTFKYAFNCTHHHDITVKCPKITSDCLLCKRSMWHNIGDNSGRYNFFPGRSKFANVFRHQRYNRLFLSFFKWYSAITMFREWEYDDHTVALQYPQSQSASVSFLSCWHLIKQCQQQQAKTTSKRKRQCICAHIL